MTRVFGFLLVGSCTACALLTVLHEVRLTWGIQFELQMHSSGYTDELMNRVHESLSGYNDELTNRVHESIRGYTDKLTNRVHESLKELMYELS